jgi:hypothetical protein
MLTAQLCQPLPAHKKKKKLQPAFADAKFHTRNAHGKANEKYDALDG